MEAVDIDRLQDVYVEHLQGANTSLTDTICIIGAEAHAVEADESDKCLYHRQTMGQERPRVFGTPGRVPGKRKPCCRTTICVGAHLVDCCVGPRLPSLR